MATRPVRLRFLLSAALLLGAPALGGCSKAARVAMTLERDHRAIVVLGDGRTRVQVDAIGDEPVTLDVEPPPRSEPPGIEPGRTMLGTFRATLAGPAKLTITNRTASRSLVEIKATGHDWIDIRRPPAPIGEDPPPDG